MNFDEITRLAAYICQTPIALVTLIDADRQWFKSRLGIDVEQTSRDVSYCAHAINSQELFIIPDSEKDERFSDFPTTPGIPAVRCYAGAPLVTSKGFGVGTLCVVDNKPRELSPEQKDALRSLSRIVVHYLELRRATAESNDASAKLKSTAIATLEHTGDVVRLAKATALFKFASSIAHEINNPLAIVSARAGSLLMKFEKRETPIEEIRKSLEIIQKATERASHVIRSLRYITEDSAEDTIETYNLDQLFTPIYELLGEKLKMQMIQFDIKYERGIQFEANLANMQNAIINMIMNSADACVGCPDPKIDVKASFDSLSRKIQILIEDNGSGIEKEIEEQIFVPLMSGKEVGKGVGLGLSIAKRTIEEHHGTIFLKSPKNPTVFSIEFPILQMRKNQTT